MLGEAVTKIEDIENAVERLSPEELVEVPASTSGRLTFSMADAKKLDEMRLALREGNLKAAARLRAGLRVEAGCGGVRATPAGRGRRRRRAIRGGI